MVWKTQSIIPKFGSGIPRAIPAIITELETHGWKTGISVSQVREMQAAKSEEEEREKTDRRGNIYGVEPRC
jgi:hypothetical protein